MNDTLLLVIGQILIAFGMGLSAWTAGKLKAPPRLVHALWLLVLLKLVTPPWIDLPIPGFEVGDVLEVRAASPWGSASVPSFAASESARDGFGVWSISGPAPGPSGWLERARRGTTEPWVWIALVWSLGAAVQGIRGAGRRRALSRVLQALLPARTEVEADRSDRLNSIDDLRREVALWSKRLSLRRAPEVLVAPGPLGPMTWVHSGGALLIVPRGWAEACAPGARRAVVVHELAHLALRHSWTRAFESFVATVHWWCPLVWWARGELRQAEEEACDEFVRKWLPGAEAEFAQALLAVGPVASGSPALPAAAMGLRDERSLERRIRRLFAPYRRTRRARAAGAAALVFTACALPLGAAKVSGQPFALQFSGAGSPALLGSEGAPHRFEAELALALAELDGEVRDQLAEASESLEELLAETSSGVLGALHESLVRRPVVVRAFESSPQRVPSVVTFLGELEVEARVMARLDGTAPSAMDLLQARRLERELAESLEELLELRRDTIGELRLAFTGRWVFWRAVSKGSLDPKQVVGWLEHGLEGVHSATRELVLEAGLIEELLRPAERQTVRADARGGRASPVSAE